jgi:glycosyltransferase involved in cell wall biosynthesis
VPDQPMLEMLNTADVCVNPDVANEMNDKSTMNKIMEYMALGKPVVQFDLAEGRYSAREASLYAEKNNELDLARKILQLLDDLELRIKMGRFGRNRVENELEWKHEAPKLLRAYQATRRPTASNLRRISNQQSELIWDKALFADLKHATNRV